MKIVFKCTTCGNCCRQRGYVFIDKKEIKGLAEVLELDEQEFLRRYSEKVDRRLRITGDYDRPCIFLEENCCRVYEKRPSQCRTFPFWRANFRYSGRLKEISSYCKGIKIEREEIKG